MKNVLGIDHPLVCVNDIERVRQVYVDLGFLNRGISQHPWGTSNSVLIFKNQLFELMGIGDENLLDLYPAGNFIFGRHIERHLRQREGVCLTALHSEDATQDASELEKREIGIAGTIDFGRDVTRSDGSSDRTKTVLKIIENGQHPRLSLFLCQQFRRDLIEYPEWMDHPNGVTSIAALTVLAPAEEVDTIATWLGVIHQAKPNQVRLGHSEVATANGRWRVVDEAQFTTLYPEVQLKHLATGSASICGIDLQVHDSSLVESRNAKLGLRHIRTGSYYVINECKPLGGVVLRFGDFRF